MKLLDQTRVLTQVVRTQTATPSPFFLPVPVLSPFLSPFFLPSPPFTKITAEEARAPRRLFRSCYKSALSRQHEHRRKGKQTLAEQTHHGPR